MQAAPVPSGCPSAPTTPPKNSAEGETMPAGKCLSERESVGNREPENAVTSDAEMTTTTTTTMQTESDVKSSPVQEGTGMGPTPTPTATALPSIRDLFPDHLFEAQQRLDLPVDHRPRDPFLSHVPSLSEREMQREAFAVLTAPQSSPIASRSTIQSRSPRLERGAFTFPRSPSTACPPKPPQASFDSLPIPPSSIASSNFPSATPVPVPVPISSLIHVPASSTVPSATPTRTEPARPRARHQHTYSSDASAAAASLLTLSISSSQASTSPSVATNGLQQRQLDDREVDPHDNDDDSMFIFEMDEARDRVRGREDSKERREDEMEGVETAPTSVDSHMSDEAKPKEGTIENSVQSKEAPSSETTEKGRGGPSSAKNDIAGDRDPASSAENDGGEPGEGEAEGDADGGDGKRHTCPHCKKRFNRPSSLKIHLNTHTGAKPFECPYPGCGRQFNVSSNMRRHYRNHSTPAPGVGPGAIPGMGMGMPMSMQDPFGPRPAPSGVLGLHVGSSGYPGPPQHQHQHHAQMQSHREMERERLMMRGHGAPFGGSSHVAPSAYRPPLQTIRVAPPPGAYGQHGISYGSYPPAVLGSRETDLDRRERLRRMDMGRENWEVRERERERMGRLERRIPPNATAQSHPQAYQHGRTYSHQSPPPRERPFEYRIDAETGRPISEHRYQPSLPPSIPPSYPRSDTTPKLHSQSQPRPPDAAPVPVLRTSHSYGTIRDHPYTRSSPSQSHSGSRERYSSGAGSPVLSPAIAVVSSLPARNWRGHSHTHSAPAFAGQAYTGIELPPLGTGSATRSPYERVVPLPAGHGRSHSLSTSEAHASPVPPLPPLSNIVRVMDEREAEWKAKRSRRDSTAAMTGHESDREGMQDLSEHEHEEMQVVRDIDMRDSLNKTSDPPNAQQNGYVRPSPQQVERRDEPHAGLLPATESLSSPVLARSPSFQGRELRRNPSNSQAVPTGSSSSRDRAYSNSHYSHSRTGSSSSSGHGHDYISHPYARARHAHSRSREVAAVAIDAVVSPRLATSMSASPRPSLPIMSTSVSPRASRSASVISSPRQTLDGASADVTTRPLLRDPGDSRRSSSSKMTSPISANGHASRFPVYTFPPPAPPPGLVLATGSPSGSAVMEVEN